MTSVEATRHDPQSSTSRGMIGRVEADRKILLETAHGQTAAKELRHTPMRQEWNLQNAIRKTELLGALAKPCLRISGRPCASATKSDIQSVAA